MSDKQLIKKLQAGDQQAFKIIFDQYYALMCAVAYEYVKDDHISQNIVGDVLLSLWEKREQLQIATFIKPYLLRAVRNKSIDYLRIHLKETQARNNNAIENCFIPDEEIFENLIKEELENKIKRIVDSMPKESRKVFILSRYEDKSYQEIAEELNISVNTVKYHIKQALNILRHGLKDFLLILLVFYSYFLNN